MHIPWKYLFCVLGTVLLCGFSGFQGNHLGTDEVSLYAWLHYSRQELLQMGELASDYFVMSCLADIIIQPFPGQHAENMRQSGC